MSAISRFILAGGFAGGVALVGCGASSGTPPYGAPDAEPTAVQPEGDGSAGVDGAARGGDAGGDATTPIVAREDGGPTTCGSATPGSIGCGAAPCAATTQACCGGPQGVCLAKGAFCGAGGVIRMHCDDTADCSAGEICCPSEVIAPGNDAPFQTSCRKPDPSASGGAFGCGKSGGGSISLTCVPAMTSARWEAAKQAQSWLEGAPTVAAGELRHRVGPSGGPFRAQLTVRRLPRIDCPRHHPGFLCSA
jgi:hypothetical protein